jgi:hypothetical protein
MHRAQRAIYDNLFDLTSKIVFISSIPAPAFVAMALFSYLVDIYGVQTLSLRRSHVHQLARRNLSSHHCAEDPFFRSRRSNCGACCTASTQHFAEHFAWLQRSNLRSPFWNDT